MNLGIAAVQAIPVPFAAKKFLSKALKYINDITSGEIVPGALSVRSVDDAGKTVSTADVIADPSIAPAPLFAGAGVIRVSSAAASPRADRRRWRR